MKILLQFLLLFSIHGAIAAQVAISNNSAAAHANKEPDQILTRRYR